MYGHRCYDKGDPDIDIDGRDSNGDYLNDRGYNSVIDYRDYHDSQCNPSNNQAPIYLYKFKDKEDLLQSTIFQECLRQSLDFKDRSIRELQIELLKYLSVK